MKSYVQILATPRAFAVISWVLTVLNIRVEHGKKIKNILNIIFCLTLKFESFNISVLFYTDAVRLSVLELVNGILIWSSPNKSLIFIINCEHKIHGKPKNAKHMRLIITRSKISYCTRLVSLVNRLNDDLRSFSLKVGGSCLSSPLVRPLNNYGQVT